MQYLMAPLEQHRDDGFGAVGEAFQRAAKFLDKDEDAKLRFGWNHLPKICLYRHAVELFLKSGIIIIHRKLKIPYGRGEGPFSKKPMFLDPSGNWKSLYKTHDLDELYAYWKKILSSNQEKLTDLTKHKPDMSVPLELDEWIATLKTVDPYTDYFRYPVSKNQANDKDKSPFKEVPLEKLFPLKTSDDGEKVRALLVKNDQGEVVRAFKYDSSTDAKVDKAASEAAEMLSNFHTMFRFELTDGW